MLINLRQASNPNALSLKEYAISFCGVAVDERGTAAVNELRRRSESLYIVRYNSRSMELTINDQQARRVDLTNIISSASNEPVAVEATTLGFAEVLLCSHAAYTRSIALDFIYVEPEFYRRSRDSELFSKRDFELSGEIIGFRGIPGTTKMLNDRQRQRYVFFLGYEGARFRRAFTDLETLRGSSSNVIFGVPAFRAGWEMDSIANNVPILRDENIRSVYFCGADNPRAAVEILDNMYEGLQENERMFIAPIGTKPHGIATALFSAYHPKVGIIYDHPLRSPARSSAIGQWHLYSISDFH